jgi:hypothetical protein
MGGGWSKIEFQTVLHQEKMAESSDLTGAPSVKPTSAPTNLRITAQMKHMAQAMRAHDKHVAQVKRKKAAEKKVEQLKQSLAHDAAIEAKLAGIAKAGKGLGYDNNGWTPPLLGHKHATDRQLSHDHHELELAKQKVKALSRTFPPTNVPTALPTTWYQHLPTMAPTIPTVSPTPGPTTLTPTATPTLSPTTLPSFDNAFAQALMNGDDDAFSAKSHGNMKDDDVS